MRTLLLIISCKRAKYADAGLGKILRTSFMGGGPLALNFRANVRTNFASVAQKWASKGALAC